MFLRSALLIVSFALGCHALINWDDWTFVENGSPKVCPNQIPGSPTNEFLAIIWFKTNKVGTYGLAYYTPEGKLCALFDNDGDEWHKTCTGFKVLVNGQFYRLVSPDGYDDYNSRDIERTWYMSEKMHNRAALLECGGGKEPYLGSVHKSRNMHGPGRSPVIVTAAKCRRYRYISRMSLSEVVVTVLNNQ